MEEYDVIVVGAGPAGSSAAKAAAERGAKTIILEEHTKIGFPQHCSGVLFGTKSGIGEEVLKTMDKRVVLDKVWVRRLFSPSGRMLEIPLKDKGVWLLDRALFDNQLAGQAAAAGAELVINTKVTGLLTEGDAIVGVTTKSKTRPEIRGKIVIAADGIKSTLGGIPKKAGFVDGKSKVHSGITWWLANVKNIEPGVQELHLGQYSGVMGWIWLQRCDSFTCLADFDNYEDFENCRKGDSILSKKMENAMPIRMNGWAQPRYIGRPFSTKVKTGLILAGAAAKYYPFITCFLSGRYAGETAAEAVKKNDVSEKSLSPYDDLCKGLLEPKKEAHFGSFMNTTVEEQEEIFERMTKMKDLDLDSLSI